MTFLVIWICRWTAVLAAASTWYLRPRHGAHEAPRKMGATSPAPIFYGSMMLEDEPWPYEEIRYDIGGWISGPCQTIPALEAGLADRIISDLYGLPPSSTPMMPASSPQEPAWEPLSERLADTGEIILAPLRASWRRVLAEQDQAGRETLAYVSERADRIRTELGIGWS